MAALVVGLFLTSCASSLPSTRVVSSDPNHTTDLNTFHSINSSRVLGLPNLRDFYPERARLGRKEGRVVLHCILKQDGVLNDCVIAEESPAGFGFGMATLRASESIRYRPLIQNGVPLEREMVKVSLVWTLK